jgi:Flp pilus assembly protein TadG
MSKQMPPAEDAKDTTMDSKSLLARLQEGLKAFRAARGANVTVIFALALIPIMGSVGAAVDYSRASFTRAAMQSALDATTLMLSKTAQSLSSEQISQQGNTFFNANLSSSELKSLSVTTTAAPGSGGLIVSGTATGTINTHFTKLMKVETITITVRSSVVSNSDGEGCVLALDRSVSGAATSLGTTNVNLMNCSLYDNSNNAIALAAGGSSLLSALSVGVVGGISNTNRITTTQGIKTGIDPIRDPYEKSEYPPPSGNCQNQPPIHNTRTLNPNFFCGLTLNAGANVTLNPGIYYIGQGGLSVAGSARLSGNGVTIVITSSNGNFGAVTFNGGATINLIAPSNGPTAGIVLFGDRAMPLGTAFRLNGGASQYLGGAIYSSRGAIDFSGGGNSNAGCTQIIGNTVTFIGNSNIAINCNGVGTKKIGPSFIRLLS